MPGEVIVCRVKDCPSFEGMVQLLLSEKYSQAIDKYLSILDADPDYLGYHYTSAALDLQFQLKTNDLPSLCIGECIHGIASECCVIDALKEAIRRRSLPKQ